MRFRKTVIAAVLALGTTVGIAAQGDPNGNPNAPGNPNILAAVELLRNELAGAFTLLFQRLDQIPAISNIAITSGFDTQSDASLACTAVNRAVEPRIVVIEIVNRDGVSVGPETHTIPSNGARIARQLVNSPVAYCRFIVINGTKADIAASGVLITRIGQMYAQDAK